MKKILHYSSHKMARVVLHATSSPSKQKEATKSWTWMKIRRLKWNHNLWKVSEWIICDSPWQQNMLRSSMLLAECKKKKIKSNFFLYQNLETFLGLSILFTKQIYLRTLKMSFKFSIKDSQPKAICKLEMIEWVKYWMVIFS